MRIPETTLYRDLLSQIEQTQNSVAKYAQQVSTGRRLNVPSDDPQAAALDVGAYAELGVIGRYASAADTASAGLSVADSALSDMTNQLLAARTAVQSVEGAPITASQRDAAIATLQGVRDALVSDYDTKFQGMYLFGGTSTQTPPFAVASGTVSSYQGNSGTASVDIGSHVTVGVTFDGGALAQGSESSDLFQQIDALITAVRNGDQSGMQAGAAALDRASQRVAVVQTGVGTSLNRLQTQSAQLTSMKSATQGQIASLEDADLSAAISGLQQAQTAQQAALGALGTTGNLKTLMDYIR